MNDYVYITQSISKALFIGSLTIALVFNGASLARAGTRDQDADLHTDRIFYKVNPELGQRKLKSTDSDYVYEWQSIRRVVYENLVYAPSSGGCLSDEWYLPNDQKFRDRVVDSIFYSRHPQMMGQKIGMNERLKQKEWFSIQKKANTYLRLPLC